MSINETQRTNDTVKVELTRGTSASHTTIENCDIESFRETLIQAIYDSVTIGDVTRTYDESLVPTISIPIKLRLLQEMKLDAIDSLGVDGMYEIVGQSIVHKLKTMKCPSNLCTRDQHIRDNKSILGFHD